MFGLVCCTDNFLSLLCHGDVNHDIYSLYTTSPGNFSPANSSFNRQCCGNPSDSCPVLSGAK